MTVNLFITLVMILATVSSAFTEAIKRVFDNTQPTLVDAILAAVTGWGGGLAIYLIMNIAFTPSSIVCLILLAPTIQLCSTLGYDKVREIIEQITQKG